MSRRDRIRLAGVVVLAAALMAAGCALLAGLGDTVIQTIGLVLIAFAVIGLVQAWAITFGHLTPAGASEERTNGHGSG